MEAVEEEFDEAMRRVRRWRTEDGRGPSEGKAGLGC